LSHERQKESGSAQQAGQPEQNRFKDTIAAYQITISHSCPFSAEADRHLWRLSGHPPYRIRGAYDPEVVK
jgi:hypothetical protein